jgi:hypothetical protein
VVSISDSLLIERNLILRFGFPSVSVRFGLHSGYEYFVPFAAGRGVKYPAGKQLFVTGKNADIGDRNFMIMCLHRPC